MTWETFWTKKYHNKNLTLLSRVGDQDQVEAQLINAMEYYVKKMYKIIIIFKMRGTHIQPTVGRMPQIAIAVVGSMWIQNCDCEWNREKIKSHQSGWQYTTKRSTSYQTMRKKNKRQNLRYKNIVYLHGTIHTTHYTSIYVICIQYSYTINEW